MRCPGKYSKYSITLMTISAMPVSTVQYLSLDMPVPTVQYLSLDMPVPVGNQKLL